VVICCLLLAAVAALRAIYSGGWQYITHTTIIDTTSGRVLPDQTMVLHGGLISTVGPSSTINSSWPRETIDASGTFAIPGLADMHLHLTGSREPNGSRQYILPLLIANGITTVRDMGGYLDSLIPLRHEIEQGQRFGPQIFFAGPYLDGDPPSFQPSLVVTNAAQASEDVRTLMQRGVDFIKVQSILSHEAYFAIAEVCRREHITFVGHVPDRVTAAEASDAGQKSIEHLTGVLRACASDEPKLMREQSQNGARNETPAQAHTRELDWKRELLQTQSAQKAAELFERFARNQTRQTPTLILLQTLAFPTSNAAQLIGHPRTKYVPRSLLKGWQKSFDDPNNTMPSGEADLNRALLKRSLQAVGQMQSAGTPVLAGTDTGAPFLLPGFALHDELALLVQAGLSPLQALQAATKNPADFLGKPGRNGTIASGQAADLLLLDANPINDIRNTDKVRAVVLHGKFLDRAALDGLLSSVEKFAAAN
jgi:imidazolonepropionase-like amidohydrolase